MKSRVAQPSPLRLIVLEMTNQFRDEQASILRGSLLEFTRFFFKHVTGREFIVSQPSSCESHHITICRELTKLARLEIPSQRLMINLPPGYGKSVLVSMWTAWTLAQYPDSNFLYISFSHDLASKHTYFIKSIVSSPLFEHLFGVKIKRDSRAKDHFATEQGGIIRAFGTTGPVVGCFEGCELVFTEYGWKGIGEIVDERINLRVYSYNIESKEIELRSVVNWFNNSENDIIKVKFSDGSTLQCTPNHRVLTENRGYVRAENLLVTDVILSSPHDYRSTDSQHFGSFSLCSSPIITSNKASVRDTVKLPGSRYKSPVDITFVKHVDKTYCIEVEGNHNFIIGGSGGSTIVGNSDAGLPGLDRFSGAVVIDDAHKPDEVHSDAIRNNVIRNYQETISRRPRGVNVPMVFIGQRLHEGDLPAWLENGNDTHEWDIIKLKGLGDNNEALYPEVMPKDKLLALQEKSPYVFASQYQQNPIPAGGALFKPEWFVTLDEEPQMLTTFITADTAETSKSYNDATVFSFWGMYEIESFGRKTGQMALHWIDCLEIRVEPKDLRDNFLDFWQQCMLYDVPPSIVAIEKKSTGVTLSSVLSEMRGIKVWNIERTRASGGKAQRFLAIQPYIAEKRVSFPIYGKHVALCTEHMSKLTANDTHRFDDIGDTCADAIKLALIDKTLQSVHNKQNGASSVMATLGQQFNRRQHLTRNR